MPNPLFNRFKHLAPAGSVSDDLARILTVPLRAPPAGKALAEISSRWEHDLGRGDVQCECVSRFRRGCCRSLLPVQAWALEEARQQGGLLGAIGVGHGKTLLNLLTPMATGAKVAVLFVPRSLKVQLEEVDYKFYGQHWNLPNLANTVTYRPGIPFLHIVSYTQLSGSSAGNGLLERIKPDTIILDEAHSLRNSDATRTKRFLRYLNANPQARLYCWSGTLTSRSIKDYATLSRYALRHSSPVPAKQPVLESWAAVLDPDGGEDTNDDLTELQRVLKAPTVSVAFSQRLNMSPGVVSSGDRDSCQASLRVERLKISIPKLVSEAIETTRKSWQRPDGEEFDSPLALHRTLHQLSSGFYYRWVFPRRETPAQIKAWLEARADWNKEVRSRLAGFARVDADSPRLLYNAAKRWHQGYSHEGREYAPRTKNGPSEVWASETWPAWELVRGTVQPETEPVWLSDFHIEHVIGQVEGPVALWTGFTAFAHALSKAGGWSYFGAGEEANRELATVSGNRPAVISIKAHGTGKNLQVFSSAVICQPPSDGAAWEQLLGRHHRTGQLADEVSFRVYAHGAFQEDIDKAQTLSAHIERTWGSRMKLLSVATWY